MRKILISVLTIAVVAVVAFMVTGAMADSSPKNTASNTVLTGTYHQTNNGIPHTEMSAVVTNGKIEVTLKLDSGQEGDSDVTGIYWAGTFDISNTSDSFSVVSQADKDKLELSVVGSQDSTKKFDYDNGDLNFLFSMMGMTTTVHLSK
jgi:hypothetical protein